MSSENIMVLPTGPNVDKAWAVYTGLLHESLLDRELARDVDHQQRIAEAEANWRKLFEKWAGVKPVQQSAAS